ncbi:3-phosphoglycerate dehydrogenase [Sphingobacterium siyangense]|uniref:3-phosphoglycerate dehydrogenase n=1 Tax=Sphingobacterium siyangense TaxID=459529 RepID=A0A420FH56_9SPHI|nr:D-2-hydroxyacid dehydrogenase family protein [Sphingobacterium siyangense]QRY58537.1 D-2-hydroxyacid dehydrogenase family protein [Sphingobacterium siyangense]RKF32274.1 3-phosphoglycerate dehydrogenase [Sphingobacterium siyangense]
MRITILDDYQDAVRKLDCFKILDGHDVQILKQSYSDPALLAEKLSDTEALVLIRERTRITEDLLAQLPKLKLISQTGKISNHLDLAVCSRFHVAVAESMGSPVAPAELTWLLIMNALRGLPKALSDMDKGLWQTNIGDCVAGKTIGIWSYGKIGKRIAQYAKAFGAQVIVWGSENSREEAVRDGFLAAASKSDFFHFSDVVTLHLRLVPETRGVVKLEDLRSMKPTALFVNTSRAELVEEGALLTALETGVPGMAAVDVYESEPIFDPNYPLLQLPNVLCTPHIGYVEKNGYEQLFRLAFENIVAFSEGDPQHIANPAVLTR